jgi:hypothetical protein
VIIYFIGDVHGKIAEYTRILKRDVGTAPCLQLGDMGLGFSGTVLPIQLPQHSFIRGNHDDPAACRAHRNYAGDYGTLSGVALNLAEVPYPVVFFCGGAISIDSEWRKAWNAQEQWEWTKWKSKSSTPPRKVWWEDEEMSQADLDEALALYVATKPDIVATHEAPTKAAEFLLAHGFRPEKRECAYTRTSRTLQQMLDAHQPKRWLFGHYHRDMEFTLGSKVNGTIFNCLTELSLLGVDTEKL